MNAALLGCAGEIPSDVETFGLVRRDERERTLRHAHVAVKLVVFIAPLTEAHHDPSRSVPRWYMVVYIH